MGCGSSSDQPSRRSQDRNNRYRRRHGYNHGGCSDEGADHDDRDSRSHGGSSYHTKTSHGQRSKAASRITDDRDSDDDGAGTVRSHYLTAPGGDGRSSLFSNNSGNRGDPSNNSSAFYSRYEPLFEGRVFISPEEYQQLARRASRQQETSGDVGEPPIHLGVVDARWSSGDPRWGAEDFAKGPRLPDAVFLEANSDLADMQPGGERPLPSAESIMHLLMEETSLVLPRQKNRKKRAMSTSHKGSGGSGRGHNNNDDNPMIDRYYAHNFVRNVVVCYDASHGAWAACRAWWMLDQLGIECYVINGGLKHFVAKGLAVDKKTLAKPPLGGKRWADGDLTEDHVQTIKARWPGTRPGVARGEVSFSEGAFRYEAFNSKTQVLLDSRPRPVFQTEKRSLMNGLPGHIKGACCDGFMAKLVTKKLRQQKQPATLQDREGAIGLNIPLPDPDNETAEARIKEEEFEEVEVQVIKDDQTLREQVIINTALPVTDDSSSDIDAGSPEGKFKQPVLYCGLGITACFNIACLTHSLRRNGLNVSELREHMDPIPSNIPTPQLYVGSWIEYQRNNHDEILESLLAKNPAIVSRVVRGNKENGSSVQVVKQIFKRKQSEDSATGYLELLVAEDVGVEEYLCLENEDEVLQRLRSNNKTIATNSTNNSSGGNVITVEALKAILQLIRDGHVFTGEDVEVASLTGVGPRTAEKPLDLVDLAEMESFRVVT